jgi:hypothetical protein
VSTHSTSSLKHEATSAVVCPHLPPSNQVQTEDILDPGEKRRVPSVKGRLPGLRIGLCVRLAHRVAQRAGRKVQAPQQSTLGPCPPALMQATQCLRTTACSAGGKTQSAMP